MIGFDLLYTATMKFLKILIFRGSLIWVLLSSFCIGIISLVIPWEEYIYVEASIATPTASVAQLFMDRGAGFNNEQSTTVSIRPSHELLQVRFKIPAGYYFNLRLDPVSESSDFAISNIKIVSERGLLIRRINTEELQSNFDINRRDKVYIGGDGDFDPQLTFSVNANLKEGLLIKLFCRSIIIFIILSVMGALARLAAKISVMPFIPISVITLTGLIYTWFLTDGFLNPFSLTAGPFSYAGHAFLSDGLHVPYSAFGEESFKIEGVGYTYYFGTLPVIIRAFFECLTGLYEFNISPLIFFVSTIAYVGSTTALALAAISSSTEDSKVAVWSNHKTLEVLIITALCPGVLFLCARTYIYHEAILLGLTSCALSCYCVLGYCRSAKVKYLFFAGILTLAAANSRLTVLPTIAVAQLVIFFAFRRMQSKRYLIDFLSYAFATSVIVIGCFAYVNQARFGGVFATDPILSHAGYSIERLLLIGKMKNLSLENIYGNLRVYLELSFVWTTNFPFIDFKYPRHHAAFGDLIEPYWPLYLTYIYFVLVLIVNSRRIIPLVRSNWLLMITGCIAVIPSLLIVLSHFGVTHRYEFEMVWSLTILTIFIRFKKVEFEPHSQISAYVFDRSKYFSIMPIVLCVSVVANVYWAFIWKGDYVWGNQSLFKIWFQQVRGIDSGTKMAQVVGPEVFAALKPTPDQVHDFAANGYPALKIINDASFFRDISISSCMLPVKGADQIVYGMKIRGAFPWAQVPNVLAVSCDTDIDAFLLGSKLPKAMRIVLQPSMKKYSLLPSDFFVNANYLLASLCERTPSCLNSPLDRRWRYELPFQLLTYSCTSADCRYRALVHNQILFGEIHGIIRQGEFGPQVIIDYYPNTYE